MTIPLFKVFMSPEAGEEAVKVLNSGYVGQGPKVEEFEKKLADWIGNPYCLTVNNGTAALQLAFRLIGIRGRKVITTPMTCTATNWPILAEGGEIVWCDIHKNSGNIDVELARKLVDKHDAVAVVGVDWGGIPIDHMRIKELEFPVPIVEDAAHAFGAFWFNRRIGTFSDYTAFSFQAIKHITCVDGGALFCKYQEPYKRGKLIRWYGIDRETPRLDLRCEGNIPEWGYKFHMNDLSAAIGLANFQHINVILDKHRSNAYYYDLELRNDPDVKRQFVDIKAFPSYWIYTIFVERRDDFVRAMSERGIMCSRVHERNDKHSCVAQFKGDPLPNVDWFCEHEVCIPVGWWVTKEDREYIVQSIKRGW